MRASEHVRTPRPPAFGGRQIPAALAVVALIAASSLFVRTAYGYGLVNRFLTIAIVGLGFYLVFGVGGQFAFSHGAFVGVGAYTSAWAAEYAGFWGGFAAAIVVGGIVALVFSLVVYRAEHFYFAIATLAFGFIALIVFREWRAFTGPAGEVFGVPRPSIGGFVFNTPERLFWFLLAAFAIALLGIALIERSPLKREAVAFRDNHMVAATLGVPTMKLRLLTFVVGSAYAAAAGSLLAHRSGFISPESFGVELGIDVFLIVLFGGLESMWGPILGTAFVVLAPEQLRIIGQYRPLIYGVLLVAVIVLFPRGLVGLVEAAWSRITGRGRTSGRGPLPGMLGRLRPGGSAGEEPP